MTKSEKYRLKSQRVTAASQKVESDSRQQRRQKRVSLKESYVAPLPISRTEKLKRMELELKRLEELRSTYKEEGLAKSYAKFVTMQISNLRKGIKVHRIKLGLMSSKKEKKISIPSTSGV